MAQPPESYATMSHETFIGVLQVMSEVMRETDQLVTASVLREAMERVKLLSALQSLGAAQPADEMYCSILRTRGKIQAIKKYRELQGGGLKDAKEAIEELERRYGVSTLRRP